MDRAGYRVIHRDDKPAVSSLQHPTPVVLQALAALEMDLAVMFEVIAGNVSYYYELLPAGWLRLYKQDGMPRTLERVRNAITLMK